MSVKIVKKLSAWFVENARDLPWRRTPDPYRIWLSEIMLQQTQVATVIPYFERFTSEFPEVTDLAGAPLERVLKLWAGLGYYSRARNLHRGALAIAERFRAGKGFPQNREEWLQIPGVGEYTAGAICSISLHQPEPIVDGNVVRVLSRIHAIQKLDAKKTEIWRRSRELVEIRGVKPAVLNQALMELGALVCSPLNPACDQCPVSRDCAGISDPSRFPEKKPGKQWKSVQETRLVILRPDHQGGFEVLLTRNPQGAWRAGLWDFPERPDGSVTRSSLTGEFELRYVVTNHRVVRTHRVLKVRGTGRGREEVRNPESRWFSTRDLPGVPAPVRKALARIVD
ncbi:MAG: A/G-specific adenine glycosylase [Proteobacteria bacterium]|nr:A/G-specific adenine glycosylase [Pseudomonadota bacterium]